MSSSSHNPPSSATGTTSVLRPAFARNNTSVRIVNDPAVDTGHQSMANLQLDPDEMGNDMLTLGDLPHLIEVEQARLHPERTDRKLIADLSPVQAMVIKYFALLQIQRSALSDAYDTDEVLDLLSKRKDFWNKLFKGAKKEKEVKKKGTSQAMLLRPERALKFFILPSCRCLWSSSRPARRSIRIRLCPGSDGRSSQGAHLCRGCDRRDATNGCVAVVSSPLSWTNTDLIHRSPSSRHVGRGYLPKERQHPPTQGRQ